MIDIITQMKPTTFAALTLLLALGFLGAVILKLIKSGKAKSPKDLVQVARDRAATSKATKEAHKQAEVANAEPVASSRLSRIGARPVESDDAGDSDEALGMMTDSESFAEDVAADEPVADDPVANEPMAEDGVDVAAPSESETLVEALAEHAAGLVEPEIAPSASAVVAPMVQVSPTTVDLADPVHHPQNWDALMAVINALELALQGPWPEDRLLPVARAEDGAETDPEVLARAASQRQSAIQLARTINGAAREQAQEVVAVVREFAYSAPFSAQDCAAVMAGIEAIEWMALIDRGAMVEKRTMPLTRHDSEAPLWVHHAVAAIYGEAQRNAA